MQTIHTKAGFKVLRESLGLYQSDVTVKLDSTVAVSLSFVSVRMPKSSAGAVTQRRP